MGATGLLANLDKTIGNLSFSLDIGLVAVIIGGALLYYLGRLISDTQTQKYSKEGPYFEGLFFLSAVVSSFFSFYIIYYISSFGFSSLLSKAWYWIFLAEIIPTWILVGLSKGYKLKKYEKKENWIKKRLISISSYDKKYKETIQRLTYLSIPLSIFSIIQIESQSNLILTSLAIFYFFLIISLLAMLYGYRKARYPQVEIYLEDKKKPIEGKVLNFGEYVFLLKNGEKKTYVNKDKIEYIEEKMSKKKEKDDENE